MGAVIVAVIVVVIVVFVVWKSFHSVGATEVGLVGKRFAFRKLDEDNPIAFRGEAGYQATMLMPGLRFKLWPLFGVKKFPWVQVPAGEIGVVIAQVGAPLPIGAKSAVYKPELANFSNLHTFTEQGGQKGVQRPVLPPGTLVPIHPVAFLVLTPQTVYGLPVSPDLASQAKGKTLTPESFGLSPDQLRVVVITPDVGGIDVVGVVTALEGEPLPSGDIASRLGGFEDVVAIEASNAGGSTATTDAQLIDLLLGSKNNLHNNYQDFQAFLDNGGKIGLQHDTLLYGAYLLNPFLVRVDLVPMLVVNQGEVAVIKGFVGLPTDDTSGAEFKFGSIVRPGHRGIWQEPLRTGKYAINPRVYAAEIVPTFILTLNWADATSEAHDLDAQLSSIVGKSREGFIFQIDLQVQIHVPDTKAPKVISMVGTMRNLVSEVLQSAVGNHFRNTLQALEAVKFIETRREVQAAAFEAITRYLSQYDVETKGVYIQDVAFPEALVVVLTQREIANQEKATFEEQQRAETSRIEMEKAKGTANMQSQLASAQVGVQIKTNEAQAREQEAKGEAAYVQLTGEAEGARRQAIGLGEAKATEALGLARAIGFNAQKEALGGPATAVVAVANAVADGHITVVPEVLVTGGGGGSFDGLAATLMRYLGTNGSGAGNGTRTTDPPPGLSTPVETAEVTRDESEGALGTERSDEQRDVTS
jgi:regulator of protease activity HflC (stomatin/prohibitin superfamily)